ncbi:hypothetical protein FKM82_000684 [Ascaphus truei]
MPLSLFPMGPSLAKGCLGSPEPLLKNGLGEIWTGVTVLPLMRDRGGKWLCKECCTALMMTVVLLGWDVILRALGQILGLQELWEFHLGIWVMLLILCLLPGELPMCPHCQKEVLGIAKSGYFIFTIHGREKVSSKWGPLMKIGDMALMKRKD